MATVATAKGASESLLALSQSIWDKEAEDILVVLVEQTSEGILVLHGPFSAGEHLMYSDAGEDKDIPVVHGETDVALVGDAFAGWFVVPEGYAKDMGQGMSFAVGEYRMRYYYRQKQ